MTAPGAIVSGLFAYEDYPFDAIDPTCFGYLARALDGKTVNGLLSCLECFLEVTDQAITREFLKDSRFSTIALEFLGALNSDRLLGCSRNRKYTLSKQWISAVRHLGSKYPSVKLPPTVRARSCGPDPLVEGSKRAFETAALNEEKVWVWRGWTTFNKSGTQHRLPLRPIYDRLGRKFTQKLFDSLDAWYRVRNSTRIPCLRSLASFIGQYVSKITPSDFRDRNFMSVFWADFRVYYVRSSWQEGKGARLSTITSKWKIFGHILRNHLYPDGLFAEPWGELPTLQVVPVPGSQTRLKTTNDGYEVKTKILTHIPVHVSDEEAYSLLFKKIRQDFEIVGRMAESLCDDIWRRYKYRVKNENRGTPRSVQPVGTNSGNNKWLTDRANPAHLKNACATFAKIGWTPHTKAPLKSLYPLPITLTAYELALPVADALYPHCILLVMAHPKITTSFLEGLELFDTNGRRTGFIDSKEEGSHLIGHKERRGPKLAQQRIKLTEQTASLVRQMIALTDPVRDYLRAQKNDNWRFLLLSCGRGFGTPCRWRNLSAGKWVPRRRINLVAALAAISNLSLWEREDLIDRLSLSSMRASAGLLTYLETGSVQRMSEALGHAEYDPELLSHYLPKSISDFFQERWIRIFQTGIVVEALKNSSALLLAADFTNLAELHEFLSHHALKIPKDSPSDSTIVCSEKTHGRVIFGLSLPILVALLSVELGVQKHRAIADGRAIYWADIASTLAAYIKETKCERPDFAEQLLLARSHAKPYSEEFIRGL